MRDINRGEPSRPDEFHPVSLNRKGNMSEWAEELAEELASGITSYWISQLLKDFQELEDPVSPETSNAPDFETRPPHEAWGERIDRIKTEEVIL